MTCFCFVLFLCVNEKKYVSILIKNKYLFYTFYESIINIYHAFFIVINNKYLFLFFAIILDKYLSYKYL